MQRCFLIALSCFCGLAGPLAGQTVDLNRALADGMTAYKSKDYTKAVELFSAIVKSSPDGALENVLYNLGFAYYFLLRYQDAATTFESFLKKYPQSQNTAEVHLCLGRALMNIEGKADAALAHFTEASKKPDFEEEARFLAADAYIKKGDTEKAAKTLQAAMRTGGSGPSVLRASLNLVDLYIGASDFTKALDMLRKLEASPGYADIIVTVNHRFVQIGDRMLEARSYADALSAYSAVRPKIQVIAVQTARLAEMRRLKEDYQNRLAAAAKAKQPPPRGLDEKTATLEAMIENTDKILGEIRNLGEYDAILQYRIGRCYFNMDRFWPASVAFEVIARENPDSADAPTALFGAIMCQWKLNRFEGTRKLCETYLEKFPKGKHLDQVAELNASLLLQQRLNDKAVSFIDSFLKANPSTPSREKFLLLVANGHFQAGKYDDAAKAYDSLRKEFASSTDYEEFTYRRALCDFLRNDYKATVKAFDAYDRDFPNGQFKADIRYRRGIILLALKEYDKLIASMKELLKDPGSQGYAGQVHTLLGDAYTAIDDTKLAADEYSAAVRSANRDDNVIQYSLDQATNLLRSSRRTEELTALWRDFIDQNPKHPMVLRGVGELSKMLVRANKRDEARKMLAEYSLREIHNSRSEYVESLLSQLAGLYVPPRSFKKDAPPPPDIDTLEKELTKILEIPEDARTVTYLSRIAFAKAELARMMRDPVRNERQLNAIANSATPEDLGPILLSIIGQFLLEDKQLDKAIPLFTRLRDSFPDSPFSDAAPVGLGQIALEKKDYPAAITEFDFALNRAAGTSMLKEATFGKALALFELKKYPEAKKLFEEIVSNKEWRGTEKAGALYYLGEIAAAASDEGGANAYFQRVYISHGAQPEYVGKAYLRSADMFEAVNQSEAAEKTLREFLRNPKYAELPETKKARERLGE